MVNTQPLDDNKSDGGHSWLGSHDRGSWPSWADGNPRCRCGHQATGHRWATEPSTECLYGDGCAEFSPADYDGPVYVGLELDEPELVDVGVDEGPVPAAGERDQRQIDYEAGDWCGECRYGVVEDPPCCTQPAVPVVVQLEPAEDARWCEMARFHEPHEWQYAAKPAHCPGYQGQSWPAAVPVVHPEPGDRAETIDGRANDCRHDSASGVDTAANGPDKVWRCDHCGLRWRQGDGEELR